MSVLTLFLLNLPLSRRSLSVCLRSETLGTFVYTLTTVSFFGTMRMLYIIKKRRVTQAQHHTFTCVGSGSFPEPFLEFLICLRSHGVIWLDEMRTNGTSNRPRCESRHNIRCAVVRCCASISVDAVIPRHFCSIRGSLRGCTPASWTGNSTTAGA